jgi:hypothetical protein
VTSSAADPGIAAGHLRRLGSQIICVAVVPLLLSTCTMRTAGLTATALVMLAWTTSASIWHRWRTGYVPGLFVIRFVGDAIKVAVVLATGSAAAFFLQPSATSVALGLACLGSVVIGRPLGARLARDFLPASALEGRTDSAVFDNITLLWGATKAASGVGGALVYTHTSLETFLVLRPFVGWTATGLGAAGVAWLWSRSRRASVTTLPARVPALSVPALAASPVPALAA